MSKSGSISVHTENIFPIIKKFLYSDHEIFIRELISNATDASRKLKMLSSLGEFKGETGELKINVTLDKEAKTLTISDNGIGMTEEEIDKYINQLAFSGAEEFVQKYKEKTEGQIIGHFGLGFYSSFMVASKVEIHTLSYKDGAGPSRWECDGTTNFTIVEGDRKERGTDIILHLAEDSLEFAESFRISSLLEKYCRVLPVPIEFEGKVINEQKPLWMESPSSLKEEDYKTFYQKLYPFSEPPLFWIHINVDFPFNLTGILYFPKIDPAIEADKHKVQLYSNQVYVTDQVKDILPDFLMLLHGVIDSPDIPLNVSRSSLQSDSNVKKITGHISKKVADKLAELCKSDFDDFKSKWENIDLFVKYGMLSDEKFASRSDEFCLIKNVSGEYYRISDYKEKIKALQTDKDGNLVLLYANNKEEQDAYITSAKSRSFDVVLLEGPLDSHFTGYLEQKGEKFKCKRVDAEPMDKLIDNGLDSTAILNEKEIGKLKTLFEKANERNELQFETMALSQDEMLLTITESESDRRMREMSKTGGFAMFGSLPMNYKAVININHPKAKKLIESGKKEAAEMSAHALSLALLSKGLLKGEQLTRFIRSEYEKL